MFFQACGINWIKPVIFLLCQVYVSFTSLGYVKWLCSFLQCIFKDCVTIPARIWSVSLIPVKKLTPLKVLCTMRISRTDVSDIAAKSVIVHGDNLPPVWYRLTLDNRMPSPEEEKPIIFQYSLNCTAKLFVNLVNKQQENFGKWTKGPKSSKIVKHRPQNLVKNLSHCPFKYFTTISKASCNKLLFHC